MHRRSILPSLIVAAVIGLWLPSSVHAAFDVDGRRETSLSTQSMQTSLRDSFSNNLIRLAGFGDQCTAYALDRMHDATGVWMPMLGNAYEWADEARSGGWQVGKNPLPKSVMVMPPAPGYKYSIREPDGPTYETFMNPYGHVGWVEEVEGDWVFIKDQNWRRGQLGERWVLVKDSPVEFIYSR